MCAWYVSVDKMRLPTFTRTRFAAFVLGLSFPVCCSAQSDAWKEVENLNHRATLTFVENSQSCLYGKIRRVTDDEVVIDTGKSNVTIAKPNLLRILEGYFPQFKGALPGMQTVYSARSSWSDVSQLGAAVKSNKPGTYPHIRFLAIVTDKTGKKHQGLVEDVTADSISLKEQGRQVVLQKVDVASVAMVREKPLSDRAEYCWDEAIGFEWLCPEVYPRMFHLGNTLEVKLYDASSTEDNSPITCQ